MGNPETTRHLVSETGPGPVGHIPRAEKLISDAGMKILETIANKTKNKACLEKYKMYLCFFFLIIIIILIFVFSICGFGFSSC